jgi:micrococcal nuclease
MKLSLVTWLTILCSGVIAVPVLAQKPFDCAHDKKTFRCVKYIRNYDADTVTFDIPNVHALIGENISVRIRGIDSAEIKGKQPCEKDAARVAKRLVENILRNATRIDLENIDRDKYFRVLADVNADGRQIRDLLIKNRLAYDYQGGTKLVVDWCERLKGNTQQ